MRAWTKLATDVHNNAVAHGWWDEERSFDEICALIHSEISEALEEFRAGRPVVWYACTEGDPGLMCDPGDESDCFQYGHESDCQYRGDKPEGIAVELADVIIRILDFFGKEGVTASSEIRKAAKKLGTDGYKDMSFGAFANELHNYISAAFLLPGHEIENLAMCICAIMRWSENNGVLMDKIIIEKHLYNETRPYRHGGKKL